MYVDFGRDRGRVRFTWKEMITVATLSTASIAHVVRTEIQLGTVQAQLVQCQKAERAQGERITDLENAIRSAMPGPNPGGTATGPPHNRR